MKEENRLLLVKLFFTMSCALQVQMQQAAAVDFPASVDLSLVNPRPGSVINGVRSLFREMTGYLENPFHDAIMHDDVQPYTDILKNQEIWPGRDLFIYNKESGKKFNGGHFFILGLKDLDKEVPMAQDPIKAGAMAYRKNSGTLTMRTTNLDVTNLSGMQEGFRAALEVNGLQADPANRGALFGVASNFNTLEFAGMDNPEPVSKFTFSLLESDLTQGPIAVLSAAPGYLVRQYFAFSPMNELYYTTHPAAQSVNDNGGWAQTTGREINLLKNFNVPIRSGYISMGEMLLKTRFNTPDAREKFLFMLHKNIQVVRTIDGGYFYDESQLVHQAFIVALALNYQVKKGFNPYSDTNPETIKVAKDLLDWNYQAVLKAAIAHGIKKVILPLVGAGVFNNPPEWIVEVLEKHLNLIKDYGLEVIVNCFDLANTAFNSRDDKKRTNAMKAMNKFVDLAKNAGANFYLYTRKHEQDTQGIMKIYVQDGRENMAETAALKVKP